MKALRDQPASLPLATLLQACTAPQGDALVVSGVGPTHVPGGSVQLSGSAITYTPPEGFVGLDSFTCTILDSRGAWTQGTALVAVSAMLGGVAATLKVHTTGPNSATIRFAGLPGIAYHLEVSTDLVHWTEIGAAVADANGQVQFNAPANNTSPARFYRTRMP